MELQESNRITHTLERDELQKLFTRIENSERFGVDPNNVDFLFEVIEEWFRTQGYDFWDNPFPEIIECSSNAKKQTLTFTYEKRKKDEKPN